MTRSLGSETGFEANPIHPVADDGQPRGRNRCQSKIWGNATGRWEPDELRGSRPVLRGPGGEIPPGYSPERIRQEPTCGRTRPRWSEEMVKEETAFEGQRG